MLRARNRRPPAKDRMPPTAFKTSPKGQIVPASKVEIYTKQFCGFCHRAKRLLDAKGAEYTEYDVTMGGPDKAEMMRRNPAARTVPQIFIDGALVGGSDDLAALEASGKLDAMLGL